MTHEELPVAGEPTSIEVAVWALLRSESGEADSFKRRAAIEELRARVLRIARRMVGRKLDVEDVVQDALESILRSARGEPKPPGRFNAFLFYRVKHVLHVALDKLDKRREENVDEEELFRLAFVIARPTAGLEESELRSAFDECVSELTDSRKEAWRHVYGSEVDSAAAAAALRIEPNTLHKRMFDARQAVEECLKRKGVLAP